MQWHENSIVLFSKLFSENSRIVTIFNKSIGKTSGLVRGIKTPIQQGDIGDVVWKGRIAEQLGTLKIETVFSTFTYVFNNPIVMFAVESACTLCANGLPEKAPHPGLFDTLKSLFLSVTEKNWLANYALFELAYLSEVGAGLDLTKCAVTGEKEGLFYISPRTGCSVTKEAGEKYKNRLFILPQFLIGHDDYPTSYDVFCALKVTEHFLKMFFYGINNKDLPLSRGYMMASLREQIQGVNHEG